MVVLVQNVKLRIMLGVYGASVVNRLPVPTHSEGRMMMALCRNSMLVCLWNIC